jgi:hypothetical protein
VLREFKAKNPDADTSVLEGVFDDVRKIRDGGYDGITPVKVIKKEEKKVSEE